MEWEIGAYSLGGRRGGTGGVGEEGGAGEADPLGRRPSPPRERPLGGAVTAGASPRHCSLSRSCPTHSAAYTTITSCSLQSASLFFGLCFTAFPDSPRWRCRRYPLAAFWALYKEQAVQERWRLSLSVSALLVRWAELAIANVALSFSHLDFGPTPQMKTSGELVIHCFHTVPAIAWSRAFWI